MDDQKALHKLWSRTYNQDKQNWKENNRQLYSLLFQYCSLTMHNKLTTMEGYDSATEDTDVITLIQMIEAISYQHKNKWYTMVNVVKADWALYLCVQQKY